MTDAADPNIYATGAESRGLDGYGSLRARVGDAAGSDRLGMSVWDLPAGEGAYPYHFHYVEEELLVVLEAARRCARPRDGAAWSAAPSSASLPARRAVTSS